MKDGSPVGAEGSGTAIVKFASGSFSAIAGKTLKFTTKTTGAGRFVLEFAD